jgi:hypothetical protein
MEGCFFVEVLQVLFRWDFEKKPAASQAPPTNRRLVITKWEKEPPIAAVHWVSSAMICWVLLLQMGVYPFLLFARSVFINQERKLGDRRRSRYRRGLNHSFQAT